MTDKSNKIMPTAINLHQKSRMLEMSFSDGFSFNFPCEYLRVFSPAAEVQIATEPVSGKSLVNITNIEQQGNYALRLFFDDGHDTGIYSWETLHKLGVEYEKNWAMYLDKLKEFNLDRGEAGPGSGSEGRTIKILYFMQLATTAGKEEEIIAIPDSVNNVEALLSWLRTRGKQWNEDFVDKRIQVTVNKNFAEPSTPIEQGDEVAIVPRASN
ncbi:MAG: DUF971 domain-containing protein [Halobacteria archaeon]|nr:DUF971 domain-containing protein [Halobacteria archaeon]